MNLSGTDAFLWCASVVGELALASILLIRRTYRTFPGFFAWACFVLLLEPTFYWVLQHRSATTYYKVFFALNFPQYLLEAGILLEIAINVLSPVNRSLSGKMLIWVPIVMAMIAFGGFFLAAHVSLSTLAHPRSFVIVNTTMAILRLTTFLFIAAFSQLLGLNWKNHVLQLASGLAFYSLVSLIIEIAHSHLRAGPTYTSTYRTLDHLRIIGYLCALYFWCYAFVKKEAPRKEFSPQMTKILVSLSGSSKRQRAVLARSRDH